MTGGSPLTLAPLETGDPAPIARDLASTCRKARAHLHCGLSALDPAADGPAAAWIRASLAELGSLETFLDLWACPSYDPARPGTSFDLKNVIHDLREASRSPGEPLIQPRFDTDSPLPVTGDRDFYEAATRLLLREIGSGLGGSGVIRLRVRSRSGCHALSFSRSAAAGSGPGAGAGGSWKPRWQGLQLVAGLLRERGSRLDWDHRPPQIHLVVPV